MRRRLLHRNRSALQRSDEEDLEGRSAEEIPGDPAVGSQVSPDEVCLTDRAICEHPYVRSLQGKIEWYREQLKQNLQRQKRDFAYELARFTPLVQPLNGLRFSRVARERPRHAKTVSTKYGETRTSGAADRAAAPSTVDDVNVVQEKCGSRLPDLAAFDEYQRERYFAATEDAQRITKEIEAKKEEFDATWITWVHIVSKAFTSGALWVTPSPRFAADFPHGAWLSFCTLTLDGYGGCLNLYLNLDDPHPFLSLKSGARKGGFYRIKPSRARLLFAVLAPDTSHAESDDDGRTLEESFETYCFLDCGKGQKQEYRTETFAKWARAFEIAGFNIFRKDKAVMTVERGRIHTGIGHAVDWDSSSSINGSYASDSEYSAGDMPAVFRAQVQTSEEDEWNRRPEGDRVGRKPRARKFTAIK
eukprot:GEMP01017184.1.p1 GENE.GEMP01017184.1~~GEMP01017184.1.p1  ORF type:complete len:417 (+),score=87.49 GEMP01017184.1:101-1351(+)